MWADFQSVLKGNIGTPYLFRIKAEGVLNGLGVYKFSQIAAWTSANVDWVEDFMSFPGRIEREDWIAQAKTLAAGGATEFSARAKGATDAKEG